MQAVKLHGLFLRLSSRHLLVLLPLLIASRLPAQESSPQNSLQALVTPSTVYMKDGHPVTFALHGFIEFQSLAEAFPYIASQTHRWPSASLDRASLARDLVRRAVESRVISMTDERPLEILITHTAEELKAALARVKESTPPGYAEAFLAVQEKWKHSLNCWSAASSIPARVLSNWYPIEEGIELYGATYDTTEHFWQSVKYHPAVTVGDLHELLKEMKSRNWEPWLKHLDDDANLYLPHAYEVEFLRHNLTADRLQWFIDEFARQGVQPSENARQAQQRNGAPFRFAAYEEKVLWGDLADVFHLVYLFSPSDDPLRNRLAEKHFDGIYLSVVPQGMSTPQARKLGFISPEFRSLMLEIWKAKYLQMPRFREVITSIPMEIRLSHFLNDGDSPDIPIPIYVGYLNQIRAMALQKQSTRN
jgi:hypothetical protein